MRSRTAQWFECKVKYEKTATPKLRQQLIDKLTEMRKEKFGISNEPVKTKAI